MNLSKGIFFFKFSVDNFVEILLIFFFFFFSYNDGVLDKEYCDSPILYISKKTVPHLWTN